MRRRVHSRLAVVVGAVVLLLTIGAAPASAISGSPRVLVVLCNFSDQTVQPNTVAYYQQMYSSAGANTLGAYDFWKDVSYGKLTLNTEVRGWYTIPMTRSAWAALGRSGANNVWSECIERADPDVDFNNFAVAIAHFPEAESTLTTAIDADDTAVTVASVTTGNAANFPTGSFTAGILDANGNNAEAVTVTAHTGTSFTITRAPSPGAIPHGAGSRIVVSGDLYGFGPTAVDLGGNSYTIGGLILAHDIGLSVASHEMGHGFDMEHSRKLSTSTADYSDCWDLMSVISCTYAFAPAGTSTDVAYGGSSFGGTTKGPGLTSFYIELNGWFDPNDVLQFNKSSCNQTSYLVRALNHHDVANSLYAIKIGAVIPVPKPVPAMAPPASVNSDFYYLDLRSKTGWDRAIPQDSFVLHLRAGGVIHWVDNATADGALVKGEEFVNAGQNVYIFVNRVRPSNFDGTVTVSTCKITSQADYTGDTTGDTTDLVTLKGRLTVTGGSPIPNAPATLSVGTQSCTATTDDEGDATCNVTLNQAPGVVTAKIDYAGTTGVDAASNSENFTITPETTSLTYSGDTTSDYHDAFTATGTLVDDDMPTPTPVAGKLVTFTLGVGDTCSDTTNSSGVATCSIVPTQPAGTVNIVSSFAGDTFYTASSDTDAFEITHEETTLTYTGPTVILQGALGVTLSAQLLEDGLVAPVPFGQTITLSLGGQSCSGTTDTAGNASCTLVFTGPLGPEPISAVFAGDAYYEPSSDNDDTAIVFAFPTRGAFTLGDTTVVAAVPSTTKVTYWGAQWAKENALSGGAAPSAQKGFAGLVNSLPTTSPPATCSGTWTTGPGNASDPTATVPSYMGVIVAPTATKSGSTISGTFVKIVVVKTDPGYGAAPGKTGTGVIVATFCG